MAPPREPKAVTWASDELEQRQTTAERLLARIGYRGFARARVAVSGRIFRKYRVRDPWDPDSAQPEDPIAVGPVALRLGERRPVAPHLAPPAAFRKKKKAPVDPIARFRPQPDQPKASGPQPDKPKLPTPTATPKASAAVPGEAPISALGREFGKRSNHHPLRRPLPRRPELDADGPQPSLGSSAVKPSPSAPAPAAAGGASASASPSRHPLRRPGRPASAGSSRGTAGRFRMKSTSASAPVVTQVRRLDLVTAEEAAKSTQPDPTPVPKPASPPMSDGLDDLFGMAAMGGRMSLSKRPDKGAPDLDPASESQASESQASESQASDSD